MVPNTSLYFPTAGHRLLTVYLFMTLAHSGLNFKFQYLKYRVPHVFFTICQLYLKVVKKVQTLCNENEKNTF